MPSRKCQPSTPLTLMPPRFLSFKGPADSNVVSYATLFNKSDKRFAFKIRTNAPKGNLSISLNYLRTIN
jgi:hypothetical protein